MTECICVTELGVALPIPDLVKIVQSYMPRKSDMDIVIDQLYSGPNALHIISGDKRNWRQLGCNHGYYYMTIFLRQGYRIPGLEFVLFYSCTVWKNGFSGTIRIFDVEGAYDPSGLLNPDIDAFKQAETNLIFASISKRTRHDAHEKIVNTLTAYGCRHH